MQKKILYLDYWTFGISHFKLFDDELKKNGYDTKLIHFNSLRGIYGPLYQEIQGINCYDIKYFQSSFLFELLKAERPQAVVILNSTSITDRTIILSCKKLGIKSIYLMHGALAREEFIEKTIEIGNLSLKKNRFRRALKHLKWTIPNYLYSIFRYDHKYIFKLHPYKVILKTFMDPATYLGYPPPSFDLNPDLTLVYGAIDKRYFKKKFLNQESSIEIVGNPELDKYFLEIDSLAEDKELFLKSQNIPLDKPYITYIEEGLVEDKIWNNEYRINFLKEINDICLAAGFHLVIKLHPRTAQGPFYDSFSELKNVSILANTNFPKLIYFTEKCISHYSTTLVYPILLNKPILIPRWNKSSKVPIINNTKEVTLVNTPEELGHYIKTFHFEYNRSQYLNDYIPFRDGKTKERIAEHILNLVR